MSIGHGIVESPLIFLLMLGLHFAFEIKGIQISIGIAGGLFLLWMGAGMIHQIATPQTTSKNSVTQNPLITGILLSATNPLFLLWWAAVGLKLAMDAREFGIIALVMFAVLHWMCDLIWLSILSFTAFMTQQSAGLFGRKAQQGILIFCGMALLFFGGKFIRDALRLFLF